MLIRLQTYIIACFLLLSVAIILIWSAQTREKQFHAHQLDIQQAMVNSTASLIDTLLKNQQQNIHIFVTDHLDIIKQLLHNPDDQTLREQLNIKLTQRFPNYFAATIATPQGTPILEDIESLIGEACQKDLQHFAHNAQHPNITYQNQVYIHPKPEHYHYDVMATWQIDNTQGIFFISFVPKAISQLLATQQMLGSRLILVNQLVPDLVEISAIGTRDNPQQKPKLDKSELQLVNIVKNIPNSKWRLINIPDPSHETLFYEQLWNTSLSIMTLVLITTVIMLMILWRTIR